MALQHRGTIGIPSLPIQKYYVQAVLALLIDGAARLKNKKLALKNLKEDDITYLLEEEMRCAQSEDVSSLLMFNVRVNVKGDPVDPLVRGEVDILFRWNEYPNVNDRYLVVEAKRLQGKGDSLAGKYVSEGVLDFVLEKYSRGHDYGIMVGYVQSPPIDRVVQCVASAMRKRRSLTCECGPFTADVSLCSHPHTHQSSHQRLNSATPIQLVHLFFDFC